MTTPPRRKFKTRTSKHFCEEKFACTTEKPEAKYHCVECKTDQCAECEQNLHSSKIQFEFHDRQEIEPPPFEELCQISTLGADLTCTDKCFADYRCEDCVRNFCFACFDIYHQKSSRRAHRKITIKDYKLRLQREEPILPASPFLDDSLTTLTFTSCPQPPDSDSMDSTSFTSFHSDHSQRSIPDICMSAEKEVLTVTKALEESFIDEQYENCESFVLVDEQETLQVDDVDDFIEKLGCDDNCLVKVVSIFGNTGDGKSYTLNHTFFGGKEVFKTSANQVSCTIGVWAAFDPINSAIIIDTEGLLGMTSNQNQRTRLLLKLLAVSDIVIYRTRAERLHSDMFHFLGDASKAYSRHFAGELRAVSERCKIALDVTNLSPAVVVFHETRNTSVLGKGEGDPEPEITLRGRFKELKCSMDFSDMKYVGTKTGADVHTDFSKLRGVIQEQLKNNSIRAPRKPEVVYKTLQVLNDKFSGEIEDKIYNTFPDQYFTCNTKCLSCGTRCSKSMNHGQDMEESEDEHEAEKDIKCKYQHQFENKVYYCKKCYRNGKLERVVPKTSASKDNAWFGVAKFVWAGDVLECQNCGIIYRSRQFWYGNPDVEDVVQVEIVHIWPNGSKYLQGTHNAARKVIDGLSYVKDSISSVSAKPTQVMTDWMTDKIAPPYWVPNAKIKCCYNRDCKKELTNEQKHHCRACGQGFCDDCSSRKRLVPEKGWTTPVRVCDECYGSGKNNMTDSSSSTGSDTTQVTARKVGETVSTAIDVMATALNYPLGMIKDSARPSYWVPDEEIKECFICGSEFSLKLKLHHCRACGQGVCDKCSPNKRAVPLRGWDYPVRVCKKCEKKKDKI